MGTTSDPAIDLSNLPRLYGLRVLLIEDNGSSREQHSNILSQHRYKVTSTTTTLGLSLMQQDGHIYDCVLLDADTAECDVVGFIHKVLKLQPDLSVIVMASRQVFVANPMLLTELSNHEAIAFMVNPCGVKDLSNIWRHIAKRWIQLGIEAAKVGGHPDAKAPHNSQPIKTEV